jgi:hypothetical protein
LEKEVLVDKLCISMKTRALFARTNRTGRPEAVGPLGNAPLEAEKDEHSENLSAMRSTDRDVDPREFIGTIFLLAVSFGGDIRAERHSAASGGDGRGYVFAAGGKSRQLRAAVC